ncbi:TPA: hypothetical protein NG573_004277 [Vibrio parahaemolyticus]|uniref:hypothetical protein n=1 Tax=Vibrio parahaemolyticus TaxID=670 RepID=UPI001E49B367|nr:hypothetical protein [Vibrio parahaemolyticus]HCE2128175.1 hypothetical protein [Vibrio parahaemolyticus]HCE3220882.1 hypothetical protein [Vibrio parahaemolyticus]
MPLVTHHDLGRTVRPELALDALQEQLQRWVNELDSIVSSNTNVVQFPEVV